jgi:hypothetical protein
MLSSEQVEKVRLVLSSNGWNDVIRPAIVGRGRQALKSLALGRSERATEFKGTEFDTDDDILRAMIRDCEWMSVVWSNEVQIHDRNRRLDELDASGGQLNTANP